MGGLTTKLAPEFEPSGVEQVPRHPVPPSAGLFRFGRIVASVCSNDAAFARRFERIFHDCREHGPSAATAELRVRVGAPGEPVEAQIRGHRQLARDVAERLLPGVPIETRGESLRVPANAAWPIFFAHYFVHHVMAMQSDMLFLHGATVAVSGRGLFIVGEKGAGKSTLALALGARGHGVLGDEVAAIRARDAEAFPFRRAVSIRLGPQVPLVTAAVEASPGEEERLPDGTTRHRLPLSQLFPGPAPGPVGLQAAAFLRGFGERLEAERFDFSARHAAWVGPLLATFSGRPAGGAALDLVRLFSRLRCYRVTISGEPGETAECLESIAEDRWS